MVLRDQGPQGTLGFGVSASNLPIRSETQVGDPESGAVARFFEDKPIMKFFAAAGATIVGASLGAAVARGAGTSAFRRGVGWASKHGNDASLQKHLKTFREVQSTLDEAQGVVRTRGTADIGGRIWDDPTQDTFITKKGFHFTEGEKERAARFGYDPPAAWTYKDEIRQRLISQARRLPYELPAAYVAQRGILDPLLGEGPDEGPNWSNPVDIIGDFAEQSIKNLAFAFVPFEAGVGATSHGFRRALTQSADANFHGVQKVARDVVVGVDETLKLVGQEFSELTAKTIKFSQRSTGAAATAITNTAARQRGLLDHLWAARRGRAEGVPWRHAKRVARGQESITPALAVRDFRNEFKKAYGDLKAMELAGQDPYDASSMFERIAFSVKKLRGRSDDLTGGDFYQGLANQRYKGLVRQNLMEHGVDEKIADKFVGIAGFNLPGGPKDARHISQRLSIGRERVFEGDEDFMTALREKISPVFRSESDTITDNIQSAINIADRQFTRSQEAFGRTVKGAWDEAYNNVIANQTKAVLGRKKAPYAEFEIGNMSAESGEFLVRRAAERIGVPLKAGAGRSRSTAELKAALRQRGLDPTNQYELRAFLVTKGDISKPWNPLAKNVFGLSSISVGEAIRRGDIGGKSVEDLGQAVRYSDWDSTILERLKVGGMYRTQSGGTVDFNPIFAGIRKFRDTLAEEVQIPFLHIRPFKMFGHESSKDVIRFTAGTGRFTGDDARSVAGHLWFRDKGFLGAIGGTRGTAARIDTSQGVASSRILSGKYHSLTTDATSIFGGNLRIAGGDAGRYPEQQRGFWRSIFRVDEHQSDSVWNLAKRFKGRSNDSMRPEVFARQLRNGSWGSMDNALVATAGTNLFRSWRKHTFGKNLVRMLRDPDVMNDMVQKHPGLFDESGGLRAMIDDVPGLKGSALQRRIRETLNKPLDDMGLDRDASSTLRTARRNLLGRWSRIEDPAEFTTPLGQVRQSAGMHRVADQARLDLMRYMSIERGMTGNIDDFGKMSQMMLDEIGALHKSGYIGSREAGEATATVASTLEMFTGYSTREVGESVQDNIHRVLGRLTQSQPGQSLLDETAKFGVHGGILAKVRKHAFGISRYEYPGLEVNPFAAEHELVPTLGTAMQRNPVKALGSALGFGTWGNPRTVEALGGSWNSPEYVSKLGLFTSHIFNRINKATGIFGLRLDETQFSGPLHMLFGGLVGRRVLPAYAAGASFMAADRTLGAAVHRERGPEGEPVYRPLLTGAAANVAASAQIAAAGIIPGGMTADEKEYEIKQGEVPVRRGRWWPLSKTPWSGGKIEYYRPSWHRRLMAGHQYTNQTFGSPIERLMFGYDFSPLRPFDPYRFEREHYYDRPYPVTGDYFTGPWGPVTPALNMTVGKILKPRQRMHEEETAAGLARFQPVGMSGMAPPSTDIPYPGEPTIGGGGFQAQRTGGVGTPTVDQYVAAAGRGPAYQSGSGLARDTTLESNNRYLAAAGSSNTAGFGQTAYPYIPQPGSSAAYPNQPSNIMLGSRPISPGSASYQAGELSYRLQEFAGIYGFGFGAIREKLGLGQLEFNPQDPVLAQAGEAYGASRQFWDLNLGGLGDVPTPLEGEYANLELSEIVRRFIPKPRAQDTVNPIRNTMPDWLPGAEYFKNFRTGDPYVKVSDGEMRLPGTGYERFNKLYPDETGRYGMLNKLQILGDVAPYSAEFRNLANQMQTQGMSDEERRVYQETMAQVEAVKRRHEFTPYKYKYSSPSEEGMNALEFYTKRFGESLAHKDTFFHTKFLHHRTATEDWERDYVYGSSFPQWSSPYRDFVKPMAYRAASRDNPFTAGAALAFLGHFVGVSREAKAIGRMLGGVTGFGISAGSNVQEAITGDRYIPRERRREMAVEEMSDILSYVKSLRGFNLAQQAGDARLANAFQRQMGSTMYGADIYGAETIEDLARAMPKRKREHFIEMAQAPEQERERILSTAPRLERRLFQAAWGMKVEKRPDLANYFEDHELPDADWEGWDPRVDMDMVKIKMMQREGINLSQMGYYPQQIREANLINPSYPRYYGGTSGNPRAELERVLASNNMSGSVRAIPSPFPGTRVNINAGY